MKKKIVLHILRSNNYSGAENVVCQIINMFNNDSNYKMIYLCPTGPIKKILEDKDIEYININKFNRKNIKKIINMIKPDIIHAHDFTASMVAAMCHPSAKIISHLHNNSPWIKSYGLYSFSFFISTFFYSNIITVSKSIEKEYVFGSFIKRKIVCLGNPVDTGSIKLKSEEYKIDEYYDLIFLGRLTAPKNPELLLNIFESICNKHKNIRIAVVGDGDQFETFKQEVINRKLKNNVEMYGFVENPYPILKNSKVLCLPSRWEGYGLVAIEALSLGIPVVCSGVGGLIDIVDDKCGLICGDDQNKYENEIIKLLNNSKYYNFKRENAFNRAEKLSNMSSYMKNIYDIYRKVG